MASHPWTTHETRMILCDADQMTRSFLSSQLAREIALTRVSLTFLYLLPRVDDTLQDRIQKIVVASRTDVNSSVTHLDSTNIWVFLLLVFSPFALAQGRSFSLALYDVEAGCTRQMTLLSDPLPPWSYAWRWLDDIFFFFALMKIIQRPCSKLQYKFA
jgi:hypothetical protein